MRMIFFLAILMVGGPACAVPARPADPLQPLFQSLATAPSADLAKPIEKQILEKFLRSGSDSVDLLMDRAAECLGSGDTATATQLIDSIVAIAPHYAEGFHQRARLAAAAGDDRKAIGLLQTTLALNPRQFEAYAELADLLEDYGDKEGALAMYRKAQTLDPTYDDVAAHVRSLARAVEGQRI